MCFMSSPKEPPPPPPPPQAPPVLEQEAPQLSEMDENANYLDRRAQGFSQYRIQRRNNYLNNSQSQLGGMVQNNNNNM